MTHANPPVIHGLCAMIAERASSCFHGYMHVLYKMGNYNKQGPILHSTELGINLLAMQMQCVQ